MTQLRRRVKAHPTEVFDEAHLDRLDHDRLTKARAEATQRDASPETKRAWRNDWKKWMSFCNSGCLVYPAYKDLPPEKGMRCPLPADPELVRDFILYYAGRIVDRHGNLDPEDTGPKSTTVYKPATIRRIVATISKAHALYGFPNPTHDDIVRKTLSAVSRYRKRQKKAKGIQWHHVQAFLDTDIPPEAAAPATDKNREIKEDLPPQLRTRGHWLRARAMLTVAYNSMARREELVAVQIADIEFHGDVAVLDLRHTKGDKEDFRHLSETCVEHVRMWLQFAEIKSGPLFCQFQRNGGVRLRAPRRGSYEEFGKPLTATEVNKVFKECMLAIGEPGDFVAGVSGHSCRVGASIDLEIAGATLPQIMSAGGWSSPTMPSRYTEEASTLDNAMARMAKRQRSGSSDNS